ncbi:MAG TPA: 50S ribosomal protein L7/L12 [bacterium]|jgi:large subunit ribosomal protein L7/L12|nr:50S ribosomal protein L7/L12 [bacterium]
MEKVEKNAIDEIVEKIEQLSALDLSELAKKLEDKFGVAGMMAPVGASVSAGQPAAGEEKKEEKTVFDVILKTFGSNKIQAIKEVRAMTNLGLKEAKELIEALPKPIKEKVSKEEAAEVKSKMEAIGAEVEIK